MSESVLEITRQDGAVVVGVVRVPKLDASNVKSLKQELARLDFPSKVLLLDLSVVEFIDSAGLGAMMSGLRRVTSAGGDLKLCGLQPAVRNVIEIVRMHKIVDIYNDQAEAVRALPT